MNTLFPIEPAYPDGFAYTSDFITKDEEMGLYEEIQKIELHNFNFQGFSANRKVASFGYDYSFDNGSMTKGKDIPTVFDFLIKRVSVHLSIEPGAFAELLVTEYPVGSVINWHRDAPPFDIIAGISLRGDCNFRLRPQDKAKQTKAFVISFPVKRRSLYIIKGPARSEWQHSITPVKQTRYSITLRTLRG
ncbi:MAG: alpha-ketoglutarate-dependent dioxygenase AlkB [Segetibacter sp.]|nr:alpha-ketoglutarate-dependent dioxygenase AlkB [Segetibacter sp.]